MEELFSGLMELVFSCLCHYWRVSLGALAAAILAILLSISVPPFTAGYGIALTIVGTALGIYWEIRARSGRGNEA
jgi:hypothetical protein